MTYQDLLLLAGRLLLGGYFLASGLAHIQNRKMMAGYAASKHVPAPHLAVLGTAALLLLGGASLLTGFLPLVGLGLLAVFLVGVTPMMHNFWTLKDPMARMADQVQFLKNTALLGALLAIAAIPAPWSYAL